MRLIVDRVRFGKFITKDGDEVRVVGASSGIRDTVHVSVDRDKPMTLPAKYDKVKGFYIKYKGEKLYLNEVR